MKNTKSHIYISIFLLFLSSNIYASKLKANAVVDNQDVFIGESFVFQIQVEGSENPKAPDLSNITDFKIDYQGGQQNSSHSITIINGKKTEDLNKGYFFSYKLTPKKGGILLIPAISIHADGMRTQTNPVRMIVNKPIETDKFKLRIKLSKNSCYVGEPVTFICTFYFNQSIKDLAFNIPFLDRSDEFYFDNPKIDTNDGSKYYTISIGNEEIIAKSGSNYLNGKEYSTISFKKIVIPKIKGDIHIEKSLVNSSILTGHKRSRRNNFDSFFNDDIFSDFFGSRQNGIYKHVVVPSNSLNLKVLELPLDNQPENFNGHIGEYKINTIANPTDVSVGDPITLQIIISGPKYLDHIMLPPLYKQESLIKNFKIPQDIADGEIIGKRKIFTQTIRALSPSVKEIPPIQLTYFDTKSNQYSIASSKPISLKVKKAKVVTADDAEGIRVIHSIKKDIHSWEKGIAYNYDDKDILKNQYFGILSSFKSPILFSLIVFPPIIYFIILLWVFIKNKQKADPISIRAKKAYKILYKSLLLAEKSASKKDNFDIILNAFKIYLSDKLKISSGAITFYDVENLLKEKNINQDILTNLKNIFDNCERSKYAGGSNKDDFQTLLDTSFNIAKKMEKQLK